MAHVDMLPDTEPGPPGLDLVLPDEAATQRLAVDIAAVLAPGDMLTL